jgi:hypothetical protein
MRQPPSLLLMSQILPLRNRSHGRALESLRETLHMLDVMGILNRKPAGPPPGATLMPRLLLTGDPLTAFNWRLGRNRRRSMRSLTSF